MEQVAYEVQVEDGTAEEGVVARPAGDAPVRRRPRLVERGMVSAEWAVGIIAAVAIAGVLLSVVTSGPVKALLLHVILTVIGTFMKLT